jgi:hypothetical protein
MKLSQAVIKELKSVIKYYKYLHLKNNEVLIKVFTVRWDTETLEVYLNQKNEKLASIETMNRFLRGLLNSVELASCPYLLVAVAIDRKGNIKIDSNGELALFHTKPKNIHPELVEKTNVSTTGGRAEQSENAPYSTKQ